jgi:8-oxo-dGTP pyrophosphatase MutT (NUDIX family)
MEADTVTAIATVLQGFGCPADKCPEMAQQLHRRAGQLAEAKGRSYEEALGYLLRAMAGGWAAAQSSSQSPAPAVGDTDASATIRPWPDLETRSVGDYRIFQVRSVRRRSPRNGLERDFYVMDCADWVNVVALTTEGELILVEQFRHGVAAVELEVPGGIMDPGETDPVAAGLRELREETGYVGQGALEIGCVFPNSALQSNRCRTVLVRDCRRVGELELDESEDILVRLVPAAEIPTLVTGGRVRHSLAVAALYHYELWLRSRR